LTLLSILNSYDSDLGIFFKVPDYRQEKLWHNRGADFTRQALSGWHIKVAEEYLRPLYNLMHQELLAQDIIHADETPYRVLAIKKAKTYYWVDTSGKFAEHQIILYDHGDTRGYGEAERFLKGYTKYLQTDGYAVYPRLPDLTNVYCWAHVRRKFDEAVTGGDTGLAPIGRQYCNEMFHLEQEWRGLPATERLAQRKEHLQPQMDALLAPGGGQLDNLATIDIRHVDPRIPKTKILIASDVTNPLVGETGASVIFGPQKGATSEMVKRLDANLVRYAAIIKHDLGKNIAHAPGAGAAGGLGAGLMAFTNSQMKKGIDLVIEYTHLKERVQDADFVFTGEGGIDSQTQYGKTPFGVALAAKSVAPTAPVIVLSGNIGDGLSILYRPDAIDAIFPTATAAKSLAKAIADAASDIELVSENIGRLIAAIQRSKQN
jgi:hypothetical protein